MSVPQRVKFTGGDIFAISRFGKRSLLMIFPRLPSSRRKMCVFEGVLPSIGEKRFALFGQNHVTWRQLSLPVQRVAVSVKIRTGGW